MISDLRGYIEYLSKKGRLVNVRAPADPELEITAFTDIAGKANKYESKSLLFHNVKGYDIPIVTNLFGSTSTLNELFKEPYINELLSGIKSQHLDIIKGAKAMLSAKPKVAKSNLGNYTKQESLSGLPILKVWPNDAGKFITLPMVITRSPNDGSLNVGIYRMQIYDETTTGMHWQAQKGGAIHSQEALEKKKTLDISVSIGSDPYNIISAVAPLPHGMNEFVFSGIARGSSTILMENGKYPPVPANSEIIINGYVDPVEKRMEGPFGDHTGYYSIPEECNVFHVESVYMKKKPIYAASVVGYPWHEDAVIGKFLLEYMKPLIKMANESIIDIFLPPEGVFTDLCFISIKKRFPGEAKKAMFSVLGLGQLSFTKIIIAFDEDIDIRDQSAVMWALSTRIDPERDIQIIKNTANDTLDHTSNVPSFGSKVMIDATRKGKAEGYNREWPQTISMPEDIIKGVEKKWKSLNH